MLTRRASPDLAGIAASAITDAMESVQQAELKDWVKRIAVPRHFLAEPEANEDVALWLAALLKKWGYQVQFQGRWRNIVALPENISGPLTLVGAHYDSIPACAGADDNASAVAAMLGCAKACATFNPKPPVGFVSFNREEDDLMGCRDFVTWLNGQLKIKVSNVHILEMVGFASDAPHSQKLPPGLPVRVPHTGNFLALLANRHSYDALDGAIRSASTYTPQLPVIGLRVTLGLEKYFPVLLRSDHAPFWERSISSVMWTDTSEFRNPFYHEPGDKPSTLNYSFLKKVTRLLVASVLHANSIS